MGPEAESQLGVGVGSNIVNLLYCRLSHWCLQLKGRLEVCTVFLSLPGAKSECPLTNSALPLLDLSEVWQWMHSCSAHMVRYLCSLLYKTALVLLP